MYDLSSVRPYARVEIYDQSLLRVLRCQGSAQQVTKALGDPLNTHVTTSLCISSRRGIPSSKLLFNFFWGPSGANTVVT